MDSTSLFPKWIDSLGSSYVFPTIPKISHLAKDKLINFECIYFEHIYFSTTVWITMTQIEHRDWKTTTTKILSTLSRKKKKITIIKMTYDQIHWGWEICNIYIIFQFSSITCLSQTHCDPIDCSTPGLPVNHQIPEFTQTHVHWVGDAIQPSHPPPSPSPATFNLSQHQGLFQRVSSSHQVAKVLEFQHQSFQWIFRTDFL